MKLLDIVHRVNLLTDGAPYAVVGGIAQVLWARKAHTDDLDVALSSPVLRSAYERVASHAADGRWSLPTAPDAAHEKNDVFQVYHLLYDGAVVDLLSFENADFMNEILDTRLAVPELGGLHFIRPELLVITQLLRPGRPAAVAAIDLVVARQERGGLDVEYARRWARSVGREARLEATLRAADSLTQS